MKKSKMIKEQDQFGITRELDNYWSKEAMEEYYFKFLEGFFGIGPHRRLADAKLLIDNSDYSDNYKMKLKKFLDDISLEIDHRELSKNKKYYSSTIKKYKQMLADISVNTLCISKINNKIDVLSNLLDLARDVAERKYFK